MNKSEHSTHFLTLRHFSFEGRNYLLNQPLLLEIKEEGENYTLDFSLFDLYLWGETVSEVKDELYAALDGLWHAYALEQDENLTEGAKKLKRRMLSLMKPVNDIPPTLFVSVTNNHSYSKLQYCEKS